MSDEFVIEGKEELEASLKRIERIKKLADLVEVIELLRDNPEIALPWWLQDKRHTLYVDSKVTKEEYVILCRKLRFEDKDPSGSDFSMVKKSGDLEVALSINRDKVCTRVSKGQKWIPGYIIEGRFEDDIEWKCDPLLGNSNENQEPIFVSFAMPSGKEDIPF